MARTIFIPHLPLRRDAATGEPVPTIDLSAATAYGTLLPVTMAHTWQTVDLPDLKEAIDQSADDDLIMCIGDVIALAAAINYMNQLHGHANLLRYDRAHHCYRLETVTI